MFKWGCFRWCCGPHCFSPGPGPRFQGGWSSSSWNVCGSLRARGAVLAFGDRCRGGGGTEGNTGAGEREGLGVGAGAGGCGGAAGRSQHSGSAAAPASRWSCPGSCPGKPGCGSVPLTLTSQPLPLPSAGNRRTWWGLLYPGNKLSVGRRDASSSPHRTPQSQSVPEGDGWDCVFPGPRLPVLPERCPEAHYLGLNAPVKLFESSCLRFT